MVTSASLALATALLRSGLTIFIYKHTTTATSINIYSIKNYAHLNAQEMHTNAYFSQV